MKTLLSILLLASVGYNIHLGTEWQKSDKARSLQASGYRIDAEKYRDLYEVEQEYLRLAQIDVRLTKSDLKDAREKLEEEKETHKKLRGYADAEKDRLKALLKERGLDLDYRPPSAEERIADSLESIDRRMFFDRYSR